MLKWFRGWLESRRHDRIVAKYVKTGLSYGEMLSYQPMGNVLGVDVMEAAFKRAERDYVGLGYEAVPLDAFVRSGGYGKGDVWLFLMKESGV